MSLFTELRGLINRGATFDLATKRKMRDVVKVISDAIDIAAVSGPAQDPINLYGGSLVSGTVTWISGLNFLVSDAEYIIEGITYTSQETTVTLTTADGSNPRIDVIYVDTDGQVGVTDGTAAADPAKPEVDTATQLELTFITVASGASTPDNVSAGVIYAEDAGDPGEWDATESTSAVRIDLNSTADPYAGTKSIELISAENGDYFDLTAGAGSVIVISEMDSLETHVKATSWGRRDRLEVAFFDGANRISSWVRISDGNYGFDSTNSGSYQTVTIPKADFQLTAGVADSVRFSVVAKSSTISGHVDQVRTQAGGGTTIINNITGLTEAEMIGTTREWEVQQPFGTGTLTDGATITWNLDTDPIATVTIDGNRTINFINARAGGTYILQIIQDATTGSRTVTWDADIEWAGGTAPTLTTTAAGDDVFSFVAFDTTTLKGATAGLEFS